MWKLIIAAGSFWGTGGTFTYTDSLVEVSVQWSENVTMYFEYEVERFEEQRIVLKDGGNVYFCDGMYEVIFPDLNLAVEW